MVKCSTQKFFNGNVQGEQLLNIFLLDLIAVVVLNTMVFPL